MSALTRFKPQFTAGQQRYLINNNYTLQNYLKCDGSVLAQSTYPELYQSIGLIPSGLNSWIQRSSGTTSQINTLVHNAVDTYVYAGSGGVLRTSTDTVTWTTRTSGTINAINSLLYANGLFVYGANSGVLSTSTDGITWTARTTGTTQAIASLGYGNGLYIFGGNSGVLSTSTDGITWTARTSNTTGIIGTITYINGIYFYGASNGNLRTSTDGITWTVRTSGTTISIRSIVYGNGLYLYTGSGRALGTSTDGITWTPQYNLAASTISFMSTIYDNGLFISVPGTAGTKNIYTSTDGINWYDRPLLNNNGTMLSIIKGISDNTYLSSNTSGQLFYANRYSYNSTTEFILPKSNNLFSASQIYVYNPTAYIKAK